MTSFFRYVFSAGLCLLPMHEVYSQQGYPNLDFETGTFTGWDGFTGSCCPINTPFAGFDPLRHSITSGNGTDPYTNGMVPVVAPGGLFSARLGNDSTGSQAERLSYSFIVRPESPFFVYRYAVIFEFPPDHPEIKQPHFEVVVRDAHGVPLECGYYKVACAHNLPGFFSNGNYRFRPWTDVGINLTDYIGQSVTVEFATGDCGMGGHFGYAYIDGYSTAMKIETSNCNPDGTITFTAPPGFLYQWSTGETTQSIQVSAYNHAQVISLNLQAMTGCDFSFSIPVPDFVPHSDFDYSVKCNRIVEFRNNSTATNGNLVSFEWDFGNGQLSSSTHPHFQFDDFGVYPVSLSVTSSNGCRSTVVRPVEVKPVVKAALSYLTDCSFPLTRLTDASVAVSGTIVEWLWNVDGKFYPEKNPVHSFTHNGTYPVQLTVRTDEPCEARIESEIQIDCPETLPVFIPSAFTPNDDGKNELFLPVYDETLRFEIRIFNRWGMSVFTGYNSGWNGRLSDGSPAPEGIYCYLLSIEGYEGKTRVLTGTLTLIR